MALTQAKKEMENKLAECEDAVPARFASIGDTLIDMIEAIMVTYLLTKGVQMKDGWYSSTLKEVDFMAITERMEVCVMRLVRGPYPSTAYGFRMEKGTWTASNCHQACAICFVVRSK